MARCVFTKVANLSSLLGRKNRPHHLEGRICQEAYARPSCPSPCRVKVYPSNSVIHHRQKLIIMTALPFIGQPGMGFEKKGAISEGKLRRAMEACAFPKESEEVLLFTDCTVFGSGRSSVLISARAIYHSTTGSPMRIPLRYNIPLTLPLFFLCSSFSRS